MKSMMLAFCVIGLSGAALGTQVAMAGERWQDPNACYIDAATFNVSTLQRLDFKEGRYDYPTTWTGVTATIADDPCVAIHHLGADGPGDIAAAVLDPEFLETPADLITYARLGSNPYGVYVRAAYEPVRPSLYTCDVDPHYTLEVLDGIRTDFFAHADACRPAAYGAAAAALWQDGCAIAHITPADILATAADLVDPAHASEPTAVIVASRFER